MNTRAASPAGSIAAPELRTRLSTRATTALAGWIAVLIALLVLWNNRTAIAGEFVGFDDDINIVFNPHLGPPSAESVRWMFSDTEYMRRYVPLGWLAFSLVYTVAGLSPAGYHVGALALHAVNAVLLYALVLVLLRRFGRDVDDGWRMLAAAIAAALWAFHPMKAETVGWASGLLYAAAGFFGLLSVFVYLRASALTVGATRTRFLVGAAVCYACSVFTYPIGLGLLGVFVLIDFAERDGGAIPLSWWRLTVEKAILAVPGVFSAVMSVVAGYTAPAFWPRPASFADFGFLQRLQQSVAAAWYYLWRPWWPTHLTPASTRFFELNASVCLIAFAVLSAVTLVLAWRAKSRRGLLLLWLAHFALLAPVLGWTERPYFPADRYDYLASAVVVVAMASGVIAARERVRVWLVALAACAVVMLAVAQRLQLRVWHDMDTLMSRIVATADDVGFRQHSYWRWAMYHVNRGDLTKAEHVVAVAASREPTALALVTAHAAVSDAKQHPTAVPVAAALHHQLARDFSRANRSREAGEHFRAASRLSADAQTAYNYATFLAVSGKPDEALHLYFARIAGAPRQEVMTDPRRKLLALIADAYDALGQQDRARRVTAYVSRTLSADAPLDPPPRSH